MIGHRTRGNYWSHGCVSKLTAKWLGAPPRPTFATMEEWHEFDKNQTKNYHLQDMIEDALGKLQNVCMFPADVYHAIRVYIRNRFIYKVHVLQTGLDRGEWYDYDCRLLHGMFESFVQFIEQEQTLDSLKWELDLTEDCYWLPPEERASDPAFGKPTDQAIAAKEKMALYTWWKETRPARVDGYEASGYKKWSAETKEDDDGIFAAFIDDGDTVKKETRSALYKKWREIDEQYDQEDEEMMIRLIRVRHKCWT